MRYDPATGRISGQNGVFFLRRLVALAADGPVADDNTAPKATLTGTTPDCACRSTSPARPSPPSG